MKLRVELEKVLRDQNIMGMIAENYEKEISRRKQTHVVRAPTTQELPQTQSYTTPKASANAIMGFRSAAAAATSQ